MKTHLIWPLILVAWTCGGVKAQALTIDFGTMYSGVRFDGNDTLDGVGQFGMFPAVPAAQFIVTASDGDGDARDKQGRINGLFSIGPISIDGPRQSAPVTGQGQLVIWDGAGHNFTGTLVFYRVATEGTSGIMNPEGWANLLNLSYAGDVADLVSLASAGQAAVVLTFQFVPGRSLTQLTTDGAINTTSYSGIMSIPATVPEPQSLLWVALALTVGIARRGQRRAPRVLR